MSEPSLGQVIIYLEGLLTDVERMADSYRLAIALMKAEQVRRVRDTGAPKAAATEGGEGGE